MKQHTFRLPLTHCLAPRTVNLKEKMQNALGSKQSSINNSNRNNYHLNDALRILHII